MAPPERYLLAFQFYDGTKFVLEFESEHYLNGKLQAARDMKVWHRRLSVEDLMLEEFAGAQHYDMRDTGTSKIFYLEQWRNSLLTEEREARSKE